MILFNLFKEVYSMIFFRQSVLLILGIALSLFGETLPDKFLCMQLGGRLGNQFFQVAAGLSLAWDNDAEAIFPDLIAKSGDNIAKNFQLFFSTLRHDQLYRYCTNKYIEPKEGGYFKINFENRMLLGGYFQSEKYFAHYKQEIKELFAPSEEVKQYLIENFRAVLEHPFTVGMHIRAYGNEDPNLLEHFPQQSFKYFKNAAKRFGEDALFIIFSDDIDYAKKLLKKFKRPHIFITGNTYLHDFYLLSSCKHQVISSSTFGWWAAYLNPNKEKVVVCPDPWFVETSYHKSEDLLVEGWIPLRY